MPIILNRLPFHRLRNQVILNVLILQKASSLNGKVLHFNRQNADINIFKINPYETFNLFRISGYRHGILQ